MCPPAWNPWSPRHGVVLAIWCPPVGVSGELRVLQSVRRRPVRRLACGRELMRNGRQREGICASQSRFWAAAGPDGTGIRATGGGCCQARTLFGGRASLLRTTLLRGGAVTRLVPFSVAMALVTGGCGRGGGNDLPAPSESTAAPTTTGATTTSTPPELEEAEHGS